MEPEQKQVGQKRQDELFMEEAIALALKGKGLTSPNPLVGALVVKKDVVIGRGYHKYAGGPHAEVYALNEAGLKAKGSTLYVTLEPCAHHGKTPPCVDKIIASGIKKVVIGTLDTNPLVAGKGMKKLKEANIEVELGVLEEACQHINRIYFHNMNHKALYITGKIAMSLDGKIGTKRGDSKWITDAQCRCHGHGLRYEHDLILVGIGTLLADDPLLTCHLLSEHNEKVENVKKGPHVVILDALGRTPSEAKIFTNKERQIYIFVGPECSSSAIERLTTCGALVRQVPYQRDRKERLLDIKNILSLLYEAGHRSLLVEGGSQVLSSFVEENYLQRLQFYIGPLIIGGNEAIPALGGKGIDYLKEASLWNIEDVRLDNHHIYIEAIQR